jgi:hypothetical protein
MIIINLNNMNKIIKATKNGKLYIETFDFFNQPKIKRTIQLLLESKLVKDIEIRKNKIKDDK